MHTRGIDRSVLYREIGNQLKQERQRKGLTQEQLAAKVRLKRTSITNLEAGRQQVPLHLAYELCQVLGIELDSLLPSVDQVANRLDGPRVLGVGRVPEEVSRLMEELHAKMNTNAKEVDGKHANRNQGSRAQG